MEAATIKVCGITSIADARHAAAAGADAIGLNLWRESPRAVSLAQALEIANAVREEVDVVAVMVHATAVAVTEVMRELVPAYVQLHGAFEPECWQAARGCAYLAVGLKGQADLEWALSAPGDVVLIDAHDDVRWGGTGRAAPDDLAARVCAARPTLLAGGLNAGNVAAAIARVRPYGVDAASGLETGPGIKDPVKVDQFVRAARTAFGALRV